MALLLGLFLEEGPAVPQQVELEGNCQVFPCMVGGTLLLC